MELRDSMFSLLLFSHLISQCLLFSPSANFQCLFFRLRGPKGLRVPSMLHLCNTYNYKEMDSFKAAMMTFCFSICSYCIYLLVLHFSYIYSQVYRKYILGCHEKSNVIIITNFATMNNCFSHLIIQ